MTEKERTVANPLPGVVQEEGIAESGKEVEDAKLVHLSTKLVLPALWEVKKWGGVKKHFKRYIKELYISPESLTVLLDLKT